MTPGQIRATLGCFVLLTIGIGANALFLQGAPADTAAQKLAATKAAEKSAMERQRRLSADARSVEETPVATISPAIVNQQPAQRAAKRLPDPGPIPLDELDRRAEKAARAQAALSANQQAVRIAQMKPDSTTPEQIPSVPEAEGDAETIKAIQRELLNRGYGPIQQDGVPGLLTRAAIMAFEYDAKMALTGEATENLLKRLLLGTSGDKVADAAAGRVRSPQAEIVIKTVQQSLAALSYQPGKVDGRVGDETERAVREFEMDQGMIPTGRVSAELFSRLAKAVSGQKTASPR